MSRFDVDLQQVFHVARPLVPVAPSAANQLSSSVQEKKEKKSKKTASLHLRTALYVAHFLAHKALFIEKGVYAMIHKVRVRKATGVRDALERIDPLWKKSKGAAS